MKRRKQRNYNGNPLAYYREHFEEFKDYKNRSQLSRGDSGMYRALKRAGRLEEAYPEANELAVECGRRLGKGELELSSEDKRKIIDIYELFGGNASEASKHLFYAISTVWKIWKNKGLITKLHKLTKLEEKEVFEAYETFGGNACKASKHLPYCQCTFLKYWKKAKKETRRRGRPRKI